MWISVKLNEEEMDRIRDIREQYIEYVGCRVSRHELVRRMIRDGYNHLCGELSNKRVDGWGIPL